MKIAKLVVGIISILLFVLIVFQSCAAGIYNTLDENGEISGTAGMIVAICMLVAGIVGLAARKSFGGSIAAGVFYLLGGIIGLLCHGSFSDLIIWSIVSFLFAGLFIVGSILEKKAVKKAQLTENQQMGGTAE